MAEHNDLGKEGEDLVAKFLAEKGYRILARNWRFGKDELDIVAETDSHVVFVEVKTRSNIIYGEPEEAVTTKKQRFLIRAANAYIEKNNCTKEARFDIISVILPSQPVHINHIEDAFYPTL
ncbi:MAG TPA: YraN family protein [Bacteroidales bacterium]|nr:YraN family protein [Bacteroidales bacterium]